MVISQSGETADTIAAQREAKQRGSKTLAICNVVGSMITREAAGTLITHAGPEIGVASTKAFTCQLTALFLIAMYLGQMRETLDQETSHLLSVRPGLMSDELHVQDPARELAYVGKRLGNFDAAALAATPGVDLSLDDPDRAADRFRRLHRFID